MSLPDISHHPGPSGDLMDFDGEKGDNEAREAWLDFLYSCGPPSFAPSNHPRMSLNKLPYPSFRSLDYGSSPYSASYIRNLQQMNGNIPVSGERRSVPNGNPRFPLLPHTTPSLQKDCGGIIRSSSSNPDFTVRNTHVHDANLFSELQKTALERLKQSGNLIDLGSTHIVPQSVLKNDGEFFKFLQQPSFSDEVSAELPQPKIGLFPRWENFDEGGENDMAATSTQRSASPLKDVDLPLSGEKENVVADSATKPSTDLEIQKLSLLQVKSENESLRSFFRMIYRLHRDFQNDDELTNMGFMRAPMVEEFQRTLSGNIQLVVSDKASESTVDFMCDVQTTVEHAISHVLYQLKGDQASLMQMNRYIFRIHGRMDCLSGESPLSDYQQVHGCFRDSRPLKVSLLNLNDHRDMKRSLDDDQRPFCLDDICKRPKEPSRNDVQILIDVFEKEVDKYMKAVEEGRIAELPYQNVAQAVKAISSRLRCLEPQFLTIAVEKLFCYTHSAGSKTARSSSQRSSRPLSHITDLKATMGSLRSAIVKLFHLFTSTFRSPFSLQKDAERLKGRQDMITVLDPVRIFIDSVHNLPGEWKQLYNKFYFSCSLFYARESLHVPVKSEGVQIGDSFFSKLAFEQWVEFRSISICSLPRETKIILTLYGHAAEDESKPPESCPPVMLGWISLFLFDCDWDISATATCHLLQGDKILGLWRTETVVVEGPALSCLNNPACPLLWIVMPEYDNEVIFPAVLHSSAYATKKDFDNLDEGIQQKLQDILERDVLQCLDSYEKELVWEKRHHLHSFPGALPRILESAHGWDWASLSDLYAILDNWPQLSPVEAMQLLLNNFPDEEVRRYAINCIRQSSTEALTRFLPQLVQAIKLQNYDANALTKFLLESALHNINIAHDLYWLLKENIHCTKLGYRFRLILNALENLCGRAMRENFIRQNNLVQLLTAAAATVKSSRDSLRVNTLASALQPVRKFLSEGAVYLPINSAWKVASLDVDGCCYFPSLTVPIKLSFKSIDEDSEPINVIYKCGDDLRQDQLAMQLIRIMDKMWQMNGLDLQMVTFTIRQTDVRKGFIEVINNAETLRKIQVGHGVTGAFKDKPLASWLLKHNATEEDYKKAVENFTKSCAGYCVATYVLGACDRHSDNIMITHDGHMFHIDFGKFLGDAQMFGGIRRDRVPFVLTSDMVYVINGGEKPTIQFQEFVDLCCQAFNVLRSNGNTLITLFEMMIFSDIPGISRDASKYVQRALMLDINDTEATASYTRLIEESVKSWFTQFNFFLHNLAQLRFSAENSKGQMLSFAPKAYSHRTDPRITNVECFGYQKRFDPQKYYVYILKVYRENQKDPAFVFRSYREITELHDKLCMMYPSARWNTLSHGLHVGRTNIKNVAQKRLADVQLFLQSLLGQSEDILHCDLVYTFFHALPRDLSDMQVEKRGVEAKRSVSPRPPESPKVRGLVKLSIHYKDNQGLCVLVNHVKDLALSDGNAPDPYVKTYLYPDISRVTKRKTKVVRKSRHPTYNEMLLYRMPLDEIKYRVLKVTVWNYDRFKENQFLGGVAINLESFDLVKETVDWYPLGCVR